MVMVADRKATGRKLFADEYPARGTSMDPEMMPEPLQVEKEANGVSQPWWKATSRAPRDDKATGVCKELVDLDEQITGMLEEQLVEDSKASVSGLAGDRVLRSHYRLRNEDSAPLGNSPDPETSRPAIYKSSIHGQLDQGVQASGDLTCRRKRPALSFKASLRALRSGHMNSGDAPGTRQSSTSSSAGNTTAVPKADPTGNIKEPSQPLIRPTRPAVITKRKSISFGGLELTWDRQTKSPCEELSQPKLRRRSTLLRLPSLGSLRRGETADQGAGRATVSYLAPKLDVPLDKERARDWSRCSSRIFDDFKALDMDGEMSKPLTLEGMGVQQPPRPRWDRHPAYRRDVGSSPYGDSERPCQVERPMSVTNSSAMQSGRSRPLGGGVSPGSQTASITGKARQKPYGLSKRESVTPSNEEQESRTLSKDTGHRIDARDSGVSGSADGDADRKAVIKVKSSRGSLYFRAQRRSASSERHE